MGEQETWHKIGSIFMKQPTYWIPQVCGRVNETCSGARNESCLSICLDTSCFVPRIIPFTTLLDSSGQPNCGVKIHVI
jgi:hypothetical protein